MDYGEAHSVAHKHSRYGRHYPTGLYPSWSAQDPLHFLGHSMGGTTVNTLIVLLRSGLFGADAHPDMVASSTTLFSPFRGTQFVYILGESTQQAPYIRQLSVSISPRLSGTLGNSLSSFRSARLSLKPSIPCLMSRLYFLPTSDLTSIATPGHFRPRISPSHKC